MWKQLDLYVPSLISVNLQRRVYSNVYKLLLGTTNPSLASD
jgi:hypothetical protein